MNKNINTFNLWAEDNRDEKMQKNHTDSVNKMIDIINDETNKLNKPFKFSKSDMTLIKLFSFAKS